MTIQNIIETWKNMMFNKNINILLWVLFIWNFFCNHLAPDGNWSKSIWIDDYYDQVVRPLQEKF